MDLLRWIGIISVLTLATAFDPSLSNGTCYFGPNQEAAVNFIPCGNAAGGVQTCCQARDVCLSSNACFNGQYFVTYLAGCTDQDYKDEKCPDKGSFSSEQWVGLVRCFVSNTTTGEEWSPCDEPNQPVVNKGNTQCSCDPASSTAVFTGAATLTDIASLPVSAGNLIAWYSGFEPSTTLSESTPTASGTNPSVSETGRPTSGVSPGAPSSPSATGEPNSSQSSLSTGAKAGVGVGAASGAIAIGLVVLWLSWNRRRKAKSVPPIQDQIRPSSIGPWSVEGRTLTDKDTIGADNHKSWGAKSELPTEANEVTTTKTTLGGTLRTSFNTPLTPYQPYQHSPIIEESEAESSPAASNSRLTVVNPSSTYDKPVYGGPIYEMPG